MLHVSEIAEHRVKEVKDELREGDQILVKVLAIEGNRIKLSRKAVLREQRAKLGLPEPGQIGTDGGRAEASAPVVNELSDDVMKTVKISTMTAKSRRTSRTSIVPMVLPQLQLSLVARGRMAQVARDGRGADVVAAGGDRVPVPVDRKVAAIARVLSPFTTEAAHLRGLCVFGASGVRYLGGASGCDGMLLVALLCCVGRIGAGFISGEDR